MNRRHPRLLLAATVALTVVACSSVTRPDDWHARTPPPPGAFAAPGPFDPMASEGIWGVGDEVVYSVDIDDHGTHTGFTFSLTTTQLPPSDDDAWVFAHPVHGRILTRTCDSDWQHNPLAYTGEGIATLQASLRGNDGSSCGGEITAKVLAHWFVDEMGVGIHDGVSNLFGALLGLDCVHQTLLRVIRAPSAFSMLKNFGRIDVGLHWPKAGHVGFVDQETPFGVLPTVWLPITITANGQPALDGRVQFTWKQPPLLLGAGVLQIEAWHPDDAQRRVLVRLASARRGTPPDAPDPTDLGHDLRRGMTIDEVLRQKNGKEATVVERGALGDGRHVALVEFDVPRELLFGVVEDNRLIFASLGDDLCIDFLRRRGFVAEAPR